MSGRLVDSLATTDAMAALFADESIIGGMLRFEIALAQAEAAYGVIPVPAAEAIARLAGSSGDYDAGAIAREARHSATPAIPFVRMVTARVAASDPVSARFVHFGATSQDVVDTALVLALVRARALIYADHGRLVASLVALSDRHAGTVMLGRTILQPGPPVTFGLKAAIWCDAVSVAGARLLHAFDAAARVQFGGAVGTRAALGVNGDEVADRLADALGLSRATAPWHTQRDSLGSLVGAAGLYVASLGKLARDVSLMMQDEVGEVAERGGGSSTMPHKRNPSASAIVLASAARMPGLVAAFLSGMSQEHERGIGGWHAEAPTLSAAVQATASALDASCSLVDHLEVFPDRMRANIDRTRGVIFAERVTLALVATVGRDEAARLVADALATIRDGAGTFGEVVRSMPAIPGVLSADLVSTVDSPDAYLGSAEQIRQRLLAAHRPLPT